MKSTRFENKFSSFVPAEVMLRRAESEEVERLAADVDEALHVADEAAAADAAEAKVSESEDVETF